MHTRLHGSYADDTGRGRKCIPEPRYQSFYLGKRRKNDVNNSFCSLLQHTTTMFAFKQLENNSDEGRRVYDSMATVLRCVLEDMRCTDDEEEKTPMSPLPLT